MRFSVPLLLTLLVLRPHVAEAQDTSVPADLFYALASIEDASKVTVGDAPARLVSLLPDGADVLGTRHGSAREDGLVYETAVGRVAGDPVEIARSYDTAPPAGWRPHNYWITGDEGGFVRSVVESDAVVLCPTDPADPRGPVRIHVSRRPGGGAFVTVGEGGWYRVGCDGTLTNPPFRFPGEPAPEVELSDLPPLSPPPGGRQETHGGGGSTDYTRQEAELTWTGTARDALAHYADQLEAEEWLPIGAGGQGDSAAGTWIKTVEGKPRTVTLVVVESEPGRLSLRLTLASYGA